VTYKEQCPGCHAPVAYLGWCKSCMRAAFSAPAGTVAAPAAPAQPSAWSPEAIAESQMDRYQVDESQLDDDNPWVRLWRERREARQESREARHRRAAGAEAGELDESNPWVHLWAENRMASVLARMQAEAEAMYWDAGQGCAANFPNAEFMEDYCALDDFCPLYEAGCLDAWLYEHGGNL
jgi:hypothetical protein